MFIQHIRSNLNSELLNERNVILLVFVSDEITQ